jgi:hypothetical protein
MVKKTAFVLGMVTMLAFSAAVCWGYTVSQWPAPGIPNTVYGASTPTTEILVLKGPVAPSCEAPLVPGVIHAGLSVPFRAVGLVAAPLFTGQLPWGGTQNGGCDVELGEAAYVTAAVPCTPVNAYVPPKGW